MVTVERQAIVPYSTARMYALVEDIESYPRFLPWCSRIEMALVRGPFKNLAGEWRFRALSAAGCRVELALAYQLASPLLGRVVGPVFDHIANTFVDAFVRRADALYRSP